MKLSIDITDWEAEARIEEADISTKDRAIAARIERQWHPAKAGRIYIAARELGMADPEMLPPNKTLLMIGGASRWNSMEAMEYERVQLKNGRVVNVRSLIHPVPEEEPEDSDDGDLQLDLELGEDLQPAPTDDNPAPVVWNDPAAIDRAIAYIMTRIPGYLMGRFNVIAANEGDVFKIWREFADMMEEKVGGLV